MTAKVEPVATPTEPVQPVEVPEDIPPPTEEPSSSPGVEGGVPGGVLGSTGVAPVVDDAPLRVGGGVSRPEIKTRVNPVYTEIARRARLQGTVIVEAIIDERGNVTNVRVLKGLPMGLDRAAVDAVQKWKFTPAMFQGRAVKVYYVLTVNFQVQ